MFWWFLAGLLLGSSSSSDNRDERTFFHMPTTRIQIPGKDDEVSQLYMDIVKLRYG